MEEQGSEKVEIEGLNDKRQIMATLSITLYSEFFAFSVAGTQEKQVDDILCTTFLVI